MMCNSCSGPRRNQAPGKSKAGRLHGRELQDITIEIAAAIHIGDVDGHMVELANL